MQPLPSRTTSTSVPSSTSAVSDEITLLHSYMPLSGDDDNIYQLEGATLVYTDETSFYEGDMGDGVYALYFELVDIQGEVYFSDSAIFTVEDGDIYTTT